MRGSRLGITYSLSSHLRAGIAGVVVGAVLALGCGRAEGDLLTPSCGAPSSGAPLPCPDTWPNDVSSANSDPWLAIHHDDLTVIHPRVLLLHFYNQMSIDETLTNTTGTLIPKLAEGSSYHNYEQPFLQYELMYSTDLTDHPPPAGHPFPYSTQLPTTPDGNFDPAALFNQKYTDLYDIVDPDNPSRRLGLCELFERGLINETWLHIGEPPPPGLSPVIERRQVYDASFRAIQGSFRTTAGTQAQADSLDAVGCAVTTRLVVILPFTTPRDNSQPIGRDVGCSLMAHGFGLETTTLAIPYLGVHARPFLNFDFGSRFRVPFDGLRQICPADFGPCIAYRVDAATKQWVATAAKGATVGSWTMKPFLQGCGTVDFPPNARFRWDFDNVDPAQAVPSRCNGYGMRRGPGGSDLYDPYVVDTTAPTPGPDNCGLGWQVHWRQSIPGFRNQAWDVEGRPMKNWWPFLFY